MARLQVSVAPQEEREIHRFSVKESEIPSILSLTLRPLETPGALKVRVEEVGGACEKTIECLSGKTLYTPVNVAGEYRVLVANAEHYDQSLEATLSLSRSEKVLLGEYYVVRQLSSRARLVTDGERLLVLKSLGGEAWRVALEEKFSGIQAWAYLSNATGARVPRLVSFYVDAKTLAYEYVEGTPLSDVIVEENAQRRPSVGEVLSILRDAAITLHTVNENDVLYRDLKPQHLIATERGTYIVDWEHACRMPDCLHPVGQARYAAPEALYRKFHKKSDVYSFG
ncbi:MAG: hypothetical protein ABWK01_06660, partial [Infirmifilum sp.]